MLVASIQSEYVATKVEGGDVSMAIAITSEGAHAPILHLKKEIYGVSLDVDQLVSGDIDFMTFNLHRAESDVTRVPTAFVELVRAVH